MKIIIIWLLGDFTTGSVYFVFSLDSTETVVGNNSVNRTNMSETVFEKGKRNYRGIGV